MTPGFRLVRVNPAGLRRWWDGLVDLLIDSVASGASVGFLAPLGRAEADEYWLSVQRPLRDNTRVLIVALDERERVAGAVQLALETRPNGNHRAEVLKLMVHTEFRRKRLGRALMQELERIARLEGRSLLVLDTRHGDPSETLYRAIGYQPAGLIPGYARNSDGRLQATAFFFKEL